MRETIDYDPPSDECDLCFWRGGIVQTKRRHGKVERRRECSNPGCGVRWTTIEIRKPE